MHVVYFTAADRDPLPGYRERLDRIMTDIRAFYRDEMQRNGFGARTFPLDRDADGRLVIHLVRSDQPFVAKQPVKPNEAKVQYIGPALRAKGIDIDRTYIVVFENVYSRDGDRWEYDTVYTGTGGPRNGSNWVVDHARLDTTAGIDGTPA